MDKTSGEEVVEIKVLLPRRLLGKFAEALSLYRDQGPHSPDAGWTSPDLDLVVGLVRDAYNRAGCNFDPYGECEQQH